MGPGYPRDYARSTPRLRNPHLWIIAILFVLLTLSHFDQALFSLPLALGLPAHGFERILYLLLTLYAGWTLGLMVSSLLWLSSSAAMLLRTFLISTNFRDALLGSLSSLIIGALAIALTHAYQQNKRRQESLQDAVKNLESARRTLDDVCANTSDAIWVHDMEGNISFANKACEDLTGHPVSQLINRNVRDFLNLDALTLARQIKDRLLRGDLVEHRYEQRLIKKNGSEAIMQLTTHVITSDNKPQAFHNIAHDVTEERKLRNNLQFYLRQVLQAQEEERKRLARELHDDASQQILLLTHKVDNLSSKAETYSRQDLRKELDKLYELSQEVYQGIKRYAQALRPRILDDLGFAPAIKWLAEEIHGFSGIEIEVKTDPIPPLPPETQLVLFRIVQEALNNVQRHSGASRASVAMKYEEANIKVTITDNGRGFELPTQLSDFAGQGKLGLTGMAERAQLIGGQIEVNSEEGKGTTITVKVPTMTPTKS
jgi:two-component system, NarL family, sensor histidine kinase DegS